MANILILGDTWGITPCHIWAPNSQDPKDWFEFQFLKRFLSDASQLGIEPKYFSSEINPESYLDDFLNE